MVSLEIGLLLEFKRVFTSIRVEKKSFVPERKGFLERKKLKLKRKVFILKKKCFNYKRKGILC